MFRRLGNSLECVIATVELVLLRTARTVASETLDRLGVFLFSLPLRRRRTMALRARQRPPSGDGWFTKDERDLVAALASLIVPSGDNSPGTDEMDVLGRPAVERIETWVESRTSIQSTYERGLIAIDEVARRTFNASFVNLPRTAQNALLDELDVRHRTRAKFGESSTTAGKIGRKLKRLIGMWRGYSAAVDFFPLVVSDTFKAFYTSEVAWLWLGYDGPPMPLGYESLHVLRAPGKKVPFASPLSVAAPRAVVVADNADVVIVGCGAGGAVVAKELSEAGLSVVVLEAGRRFEPASDFLTTGTDFELSARNVFDALDERRDRYTTAGSGGFSYNRVKGVGGSTLHYAAMSPRLHESDFRVRAEDGVADDWPISYADLEPYYSRVEYELGVSGPDGANPFEPPRSRPYPTPPHPLNLASLAIKRGADRLGLHLVREPLAIPSREWQGRPACVGAGTCHLGCLISAKSSMDVTYVRKAESSRRVDIRTECMATMVEINDAGNATSVVYRDKEGRNQRISARVIVLAGNAIETPRLLLMSESSRFPDGLANSSGLVGRNFMEHLAVFAFGLFEQRIDPWRGTPTGGMLQDYYATGPGNEYVRGWTTLVSSNSHWPLAVASRIPGWGDKHKLHMRELFGHFACVATNGEQLPDPRNRVMLDPVQKDSYGLPVPCLINEPRDNDRAMINAMSRRLQVLLEAAGATRIWGNNYSPGMSSHYIGTCRMGNDPATSVVDAWCQTHDVPNLFIADGSVFVTGGAVNPALTISALALRASEGIAARFSRGDF